MICFNSGCSFTTPNRFIDEKDMYWYRLGQYLGCDTFINESKNGSSNDLIIERVMRHVLEHTQLNVFYIVNLTSLNRLELCAAQTHHFEKCLNREAISLLEFEVLELTAYTKIIGLVSFLNYYQKPFFIINNSKSFIKGEFTKRNAFTTFIENEPRILNLYNWSRVDFHKNFSKVKPYDYDRYGWQGHDGPEGHYHYFLKLTELINDNVKKQNSLSNISKT